MDVKNARILVVEDDAQIRNYITYCLENEEFHYQCAVNGKQAMNLLIGDAVIDLVLLDLGLPDMDGMDIIRKLREWSQIPIIVVSARDQDKEKAAALDSGADDYLTKPFSATELMARIRVALRHMNHRETQTQASTFQVRDLRIDYQKRLVWLKDESLHMTPMEYQMLVLLSHHVGRVLTTQMLLKEIWGTSYNGDTQALRALMAGLRRKIEVNPAAPAYIITEIGVGYRMREEA